MTTVAQYSIDYQLLEPAHLMAGKRQRHFKGLLFIVHQGAGLLQLGPHYYLLGKEDAVFLPADTLFSWHTLAMSCVSRLAFSPRLAQPKQAGLLLAAPLLVAGAARLASWTECLEWQGAHGRLCRVIHDELQRHTPIALNTRARGAALSPLQQMLSANLVNFSLSAEQEIEFAARFALPPADVKRQISLLMILRDLAKTPDLNALVQAYGLGSVSEFEQACRQWLNP
ncbi:hypothetical protein [Oceanisphaera avium]|uniref:AraC-type arabinose-binding/dimerisation domain-containing protein n=1 Tax=Oceanisphaera avium TaxID=1903694 RepID=A0A1Y0CYL2_9GAMM|nr:hypothetical protein [Oceanisphaera avium]ART79976.1 hypothetical protein CBP12_07315 [Oceanisphaera avium]